MLKCIIINTQFCLKENIVLLRDKKVSKRSGHIASEVTSLMRRTIINTTIAVAVLLIHTDSEFISSTSTYMQRTLYLIN